MQNRSLPSTEPSCPGCSRTCCQEPAEDASAPGLARESVIAFLGPLLVALLGASLAHLTGGEPHQLALGIGAGLLTGVVLCSWLARRCSRTENPCRKP